MELGCSLFSAGKGESVHCALYKPIKGLLCCYGSRVLCSPSRLLRSKNEEKAKLVLGIMEAKIPLMLRFLRCEDDDVSGAVAEFAHDYLTVLKQVSPLEPSQKENVKVGFLSHSTLSSDAHSALVLLFKNLMLVVMEKMKFDDSYNHETEVRPTHKLLNNIASCVS